MKNETPKQTIEYSDRVVAFIDILGFENIVRSLPSNPKAHEHLNRALHEIASIHKYYSKNRHRPVILETNTFSDSIVISSPNQKNNVISIVWTTGWLQATLLKFGILTRGGISSGLIHHKNGILYGEGFLSAYRLEQKVAFYPRVIISQKIINDYKKILGALIKQDFDGFYFIDPFNFPIGVDGAAKLAADGYDPRELYFQDLREHLINGRKTASEERYLAKYSWLINRFNIAVNAFNKTSHLQVELII